MPKLFQKFNVKLLMVFSFKKGVPKKAHMRLSFIKRVPKKARMRLSFAFSKPPLDTPTIAPRAGIARPSTPAPTKIAPPKSAPAVLDETHNDPAKQLDLNQLVIRVVALAQTLAEKKFYAYQVELTYRIVESVLRHDGEVVTCLMARQAGKSESVGAIAAAIALVLPSLAKRFSGDWHLNITDESGVYRGYAFGVKVGIYAPKQEQSAILFERVRKALTSDIGKKVLAELKVSFDVRNGNTIKLSNGSRILCESASEQAKIEGETHHLLLLEETQEISDQKIRKSLHPMTAATMGTIVKIGTATTYKCDFYSAIKVNERIQLVTGKRNHFFFPYTVVQKYNSLYKRYIEQEKIRLGEDSDEFQTSYAGRWIFERGMFATQSQLFNFDTAQVKGIWSARYDGILPRPLRGYSIVAGIDWGSSHDSTVVTLVAVNWDNPIETGEYETEEGGRQRYEHYQKHIIGWLEFVGDNYEDQFGQITDYLKKIPHLRKVVTDSNTCGKPIYDRLVAVFANTAVMIEPFNFQARVKSDGYKSFYSDLCGRRITFPADDNVRKSREYQKFVQQMLDLRKEYKNQLMVVNHPDEKGAHDDYPDSAMMAVWGASSPASAYRPEFLTHNPFC